MEKRSPVPAQLRLYLPTESPVPLVGTTRSELVQLLAQLLASVVVEGTDGCDPGAADETR
jgi:hypothetical protein